MLQCKRKLPCAFGARKTRVLSSSVPFAMRVKFETGNFKTPPTERNLIESCSKLHAWETQVELGVDARRLHDR